MQPNYFTCFCCGKSKPINQRILLGGDALCYACSEEYTTLCDRCGERTAEMHDKSITVPFVHNAVGKSITNPTESKCFQWDFRVLRRKLCLKIQSISHAACRAKYQML